ncbi:MAG TPA: bifunctional phosphopantothenoylcysteine decarboxylase/phosphopantothenate--cysteine ligase CoaBC, partial [Methanocorpusculum sp.]|nr:bifunctional phosphopantothenoylcysteine decarboxylase/phosphopantothenate--cysteine ligase CoaBC [Methanocorpusculum sp.]
MDGEPMLGLYDGIPLTERGDGYGSIAAVETIKLAHELRRRGASVTGILSPAACGIIHPDALT